MHIYISSYNNNFACQAVSYLHACRSVANNILINNYDRGNDCCSSTTWTWTAAVSRIEAAIKHHAKESYGIQLKID